MATIVKRLDDLAAKIGEQSAQKLKYLEVYDPSEENPVDVFELCNPWR